MKAAGLLLCILLACFDHVLARSRAGRVVKVSDGDTIILLKAGNAQVKVRQVA